MRFIDRPTLIYVNKRKTSSLTLQALFLTAGKPRFRPPHCVIAFLHPEPFPPDAVIRIDRGLLGRARRPNAADTLPPWLALAYARPHPRVVFYRGAVRICWHIHRARRCGGAIHGSPPAHIRIRHGATRGAIVASETFEVGGGT